MRIAPLLAVVPLLPACSQPSPAPARGPVPKARPGLEFLATFSIVAFDPQNGDLGVAVESKFFGVGAVVPWVEAGVGAIATQSYANTTYGPRGLDLLRRGLAPDEVARTLTEADTDLDHRQLGIVDARGRAASFTGKACNPWAGSKTGEGFAVQGNLLVSQATVEAMARAYGEAKGELAERLLAALEAGQRAGGDARGRQSAAVVVARARAGYGSFNDRYLDLRVDDHPDPIAELRRLVEMQLGKDAIARARQLERQGRVEEALRALGEALGRFPSWTAARFEMGRLFLASGEGAQGEAEIERAVASSPAYDHAHFLAAQILIKAGREEAGLKKVERALALNAEYVHVLKREIESSSSVFRPVREKVEALLKDAAKAPRPGDGGGAQPVR